MTDHLTAYACDRNGQWFFRGQCAADALSEGSADSAKVAILRATYPEVAFYVGAVEVARFVQQRPQPAPAEPPPRRRKRRRKKKRPTVTVPEGLP